MSPDVAGTVVLDALIVGAGFGGVHQLKKLRDLGLKVRLVDSASDFGGVWYWNRYPGARVDSAVPTYELSDPELWKDWTWTQRFPGSAELREYFAYVAKKWDLNKDSEFNTEIASAAWDEEHSRWTIKAKNGKTYLARFFLLNTGFAAKRHMPDWKGIDNFKGRWIHPSYWPKEGIDLAGKKVAVVGTGATGVQIVQEVSKIASHLAVFQRTPNMATPMRQLEFKNGEQEWPKEKYPEIFQIRRQGFGGFDFHVVERLSAADNDEDRLKTFDELWKKGDLRYAFGGYQDTLIDTEANKKAYEYWKAKVRARLNDPRLQELLAPTEPPHPFACKRAALENGFYECFNQPNVSLVDVNETPVVEVTDKGIKTTEKEWEFDVVISATGFDSVTGGIKQIDIRGVDGKALNDKWAGGTRTQLGISVAGFPNFLFTYGPQAPTAFSNGPTCSEVQCEWLVALLKDMKERGLHRIEPEQAAEDYWTKHNAELTNATLLPKAKSWYMGANIPGKLVEALNYAGGIPAYDNALKECRAANYKGFVLA